MSRARPATAYRRSRPLNWVPMFKRFNPFKNLGTPWDCTTPLKYRRISLPADQTAAANREARSGRGIGSIIRSKISQNCAFYSWIWGLNHHQTAL